ncbi:MAG: hypothetical protein HWD59_04990 [Coxiellaceae bacterium]|nr:MAG: hypothetical protein HWD59_04990 [Coxiellaceae bacterium]
MLEMALTQERWDLFEFLVFTMRASHCNPATLFAKLDKLIDSHPKLVAQLKQLTNELGWHTKLHNLTLPINDLTNANLAIIELPHIGKRYLKPESPLSQLDTSRQQIQHFSFDAGQFDIVFDPKIH